VTSDRREHVFLVRMWVESTRQRQETWRGSIHEVASGRKLYVTGPGEVADFIALHLLSREESDQKE
jgi:hypothetical protein